MKKVLVTKPGGDKQLKPPIEVISEVKVKTKNKDWTFTTVKVNDPG